MKVDVDRSLCGQNGECALAAPNVFRLVDGELEFDPDPAVSERVAVLQAEAACPVQAITVHEE